MGSLSVNTNPSSFVALETLNDTQTDLSHTENAVSTGKKVATAGDNPAAFGIDQEIGGQVAGQNAVNDGLSYASSLVNTSTSAANSIIGVLKNIQNTVTSAGDTIGQKGAEDDFNNQITGYLNQIDTISRSATSNGINVLAGNTSNGFDISSTSLSYVTSLEGNTASIGNAFDMLTQSSAIGPSAYGSNMGDKTLSGTKIGGQAKTLSQALGLTNQGSANALVANSGSANFLSSILTATASGGVGGPGAQLTNSSTMAGAINVVQNAIKGMQYITAKLGDNTKTIQSLSSFGTKLGDNLQDAQGSLVDADMSKESAHLASVQTKQQLAIKSLTIANGQSQNVLSLFQG